jgi:hypothetical protein
MKRTFFFALSVVAAASILSSCKQDGQSISGPGAVLPLSAHGGGGGSTPAQPAITYLTTPSSNKTSYYDVCVMDTDGTNQTVIYTAASGVTAWSPSWSPTGGSVAWCEMTGDGIGTAEAIKAIDVTVNSNGVAVGSNLRTIASWTGADSVMIAGSPRTTTWCQQSATGEIAFTLWHTNKVGLEHNVLDLCTASSSGGTVTVLASRNNGASYEYCLWSPDDSKIAMTYPGAIVLYDASTGAVDDSILESISARDIAWSHGSVLNSLVFGGSQTHYLMPGSSPTTENVNSGTVTWSPNNSGVMSAYGDLTKLKPFTTTTTTILKSFIGTQINWRQDWPF